MRGRRGVGIVGYAPHCTTITYWSTHGIESWATAVERATRMNLREPRFAKEGVWLAVPQVKSTDPGDSAR